MVSGGEVFDWKRVVARHRIGRGGRGAPGVECPVEDVAAVRQDPIGKHECWHGKAGVEGGIRRRELLHAAMDVEWHEFEANARLGQSEPRDHRVVGRRRMMQPDYRKIGRGHRRPPSLSDDIGRLWVATPVGFNCEARSVRWQSASPRHRHPCSNLVRPLVRFAHDGCTEDVSLASPAPAPTSSARRSVPSRPGAPSSPRCPRSSTAPRTPTARSGRSATARSPTARPTPSAAAYWPRRPARRSRGRWPMRRSMYSPPRSLPG